jgi:hypothetical protein
MTREILWCSLCLLACGQSEVRPFPASAAEGGASPTGSDAGAMTDGAAQDQSDTAGSDAGADGEAGRGQESVGQCCVNGLYYACPTAGAFEQCAGFDLSRCYQACPVLDEGCAQACSQASLGARRDPSTCTHDPSRDGQCPDAGPASNYASSNQTSSGTSPSAPPPTPKNACGGASLGTDCDQGTQCIGGGHCTQGKCYPSDVGNPCTFRTDCGTGNHCAQGCCVSGASGSPCDGAIDCTSAACTNGTCE